MNGAGEPFQPSVKRERVLARWWQWERTSGKFLFISVGAHLLFGVIAALVVVQHYQATRKLTFKAGPPSPNPSTRALEHKVQLAKKQSTMSAPAVARKITTTGLAKVSLPEMPAMPQLAAPPIKMAGAGGTDVSFSAGGMSASSGSGAGGAAVPFFGFRESKGGGALVGKFYDLKQLKNGTPSKLDQQNGYPAELAKFVNSGWNEANLQKYFVGPNLLYATQIFIPKINANQGPLEFGLGGRVQPKMWVVHYKGNVIPDESGTYRFVGMADDVLVVRFNGRVVLDCGSTNPSGHPPQKFYASSGLQLKSDMPWYKGLGVGDPIQVKAGESYPLEILIGEWPGGDFKAWLLIEKEGVNYEKDTKGNPILPIFKVAAGQPMHSGSEAPVFAKNGPIWKAEKTKETASASLNR
jgi:hypothetical protein